MTTEALTASLPALTRDAVSRATSDQLADLLALHTGGYPEWDEAAEELAWGRTRKARMILLAAADV